MAFTLEKQRKLSLFFCFVGAVGSVTLFLVAKQQAPSLIIALFLGWLSAPHAALLPAHYFSKRWAEQTQFSLYVVNIALTPIALGIYLYQTIWPRQTTPAFYWVAVPPAFFVVTFLVIGIARLSARRQANHTLI